MPSLDEAEPPGAARDLGELPRLERPALLTVELRRLGEEERLAGQVDPVAENVGRDADIGVARRNRSISSRLDASGIAPYSTATRSGRRRFTSPASASTALRLKATRTVPV